MSTMSVERQQARRRRVLTGAVVTLGGLLILATAAAVAWSWRAELPDPVATHWNARGEADGFSSLTEALVVLLGIGGALVLLFGGVTWALGTSAVNRRIGAAATAWISLFLSTLVVGTLYVQRGLSDARDVGSVDAVLFVGFLAPIVPAILAAILVPGDPRQPTTEPVEPQAPRVRLVDGERAVWIARATTPTAYFIAAPVLIVTMAVAVLTRFWAVFIVDAVVIVALVTLTAFVIRVDRTGLTVRSVIGWPRYRVPLDEVVRADVTQVLPVKEFGGWGWRVGRDGRVGVVLRKGEALLVERTGGRSIVVTVDGAMSGAGLLNTLADRARASGHS